MKLTVEIKDGKFTYSYEVGESKHNGNMGLGADNLIRFVNLLQICQSAWQHTDKQWERDAMAKAYLEKQKKDTP